MLIIIKYKHNLWIYGQKITTYISRSGNQFIFKTYFQNIIFLQLLIIVYLSLRSFQFIKNAWSWFVSQVWATFSSTAKSASMGTCRMTQVTSQITEIIQWRHHLMARSTKSLPFPSSMWFRRPVWRGCGLKGIASR